MRKKKKKEDSRSPPSDYITPVRGTDGLWRQCHHGDHCTSPHCADDYLRDRGQFIVWEPISFGDSPGYTILDLPKKKTHKKSKVARRLETLMQRSSEERERDSKCVTDDTPEERAAAVAEWRADTCGKEERSRRWETSGSTNGGTASSSGQPMDVTDDSAASKPTAHDVVVPTPTKKAIQRITAPSPTPPLVDTSEEDSLLKPTPTELGSKRKRKSKMRETKEETQLRERRRRENEENRKRNEERAQRKAEREKEEAERKKKEVEEKEAAEKEKKDDAEKKKKEEAERAARKEEAERKRKEDALKKSEEEKKKKNAKWNSASPNVPVKRSPAYSHPNRGGKKTKTVIRDEEDSPALQLSCIKTLMKALEKQQKQLEASMRVTRVTCDPRSLDRPSSGNRNQDRSQREYQGRDSYKRDDYKDRSQREHQGRDSYRRRDYKDSSQRDRSRSSRRENNSSKEQERSRKPAKERLGRAPGGSRSPTGGRPKTSKLRKQETTNSSDCEYHVAPTATPPKEEEWKEADPNMDMEDLERNTDRINETFDLQGWVQDDLRTNYSRMLSAEDRLERGEPDPRELDPQRGLAVIATRIERRLVLLMEALDGFLTGIPDVDSIVPSRPEADSTGLKGNPRQKLITVIKRLRGFYRQVVLTIRAAAPTDINLRRGRSALHAVENILRWS